MMTARSDFHSALACAALAAGLAMAAAPAHAQDPYYSARQGGYAPPQGDYAPRPGYGQTGYAVPHYAVDDLVVRPHYRGRSSTTGAPIRLVATHRAVSYRDLDLRTPWGVEELNNRVRRAARSACRELDTFHPIAAADSPPCYSNAVASAMYQVRDAVTYAHYGSHDRYAQASQRGR